MPLLLDTHIFLWWLSNAAALRAAEKQAVATAEAVFVSSASCWEIAVKTGVGKLAFPGDGLRRLPEIIARCDFRELPITVAHAVRLGTLPLHHRDPFDRMLVAQALEEGLTLVTRDSQIARYDVPTLG